MGKGTDGIEARAVGRQLPHGKRDGGVDPEHPNSHTRHCHCDTVESVRPQTPPAGDRNQWGPQGVRIPCQAVVTVPRWKVWSAVQDEASELLWGDKPAALMTALPASGLLARALCSLCADRRWTCSRGYGCLPLAPCAEVTKLHP